MYKQGIFTIEENRPLTASVYRMVLAGDTRYITAPGQFINIALEGKFLRRPISVCDYDSQTVTIIYMTPLPSMCRCPPTTACP